MSTYKELREEFNEKVKKLRESCKHPITTGWMDYCWAPAHYSGVEIKVCSICGAIVEERETSKNKEED